MAPPHLLVINKNILKQIRVPIPYALINIKNLKLKQINNSPISLRNKYFTSLHKGAMGIICATNDKLKACTSKSTIGIHKHLNIMRINKLIKSFDEK